MNSFVVYTFFSPLFVKSRQFSVSAAFSSLISECPEAFQKRLRRLTPLEKKKEKNYCLFFEKQSGYSLLFRPCPSFFFRTAEISRISSQVRRKTATFWFSDNNAPLNTLSGTHNQGIATLSLSLYITVLLRTELFLDWSQLIDSYRHFGIFQIFKRSVLV